MQKDRTGQPWGYWLAGSIWVSCFFKRFPAVCANYIDLAGCPYDGAAAGADIFDASVDGFFAPAFGASGCLQAAGMDAGISQGGYDPCFGFRSQGRNRPAVFCMFLNMEAVGFGGGLKLHIVIIAIVAYVRDIMLQII